MKRRLLISIIIITMSLAAITGGTLAWFTSSTGPIENTFTAGTLKITASETVSWAEGEFGIGATFPERENWNPGDCDWKKFKITNIGSKRVYLRASFTDGWYQFNEANEEWDAWDLGALDNPAIIDLGEWELIGDYYYCVYNPGTGPTPILGPDASDNFLELETTVCLDGAAGNDFQGKQYRLSATFEAIQVTHEAAFEKWGVGYVVTYDEFGEVIDEPRWCSVVLNTDRWEATFGASTYYWTRDGLDGGYWTKVGP